MEEAGKKKAKVKEVEKNFGNKHEGIDLVFNKAGVSVSGFFDGIVGIKGGVITWSELDDIRAELGVKTEAMAQ